MRRFGISAPLMRLFGCVAVLAVLAACSGSNQVSSQNEAARYRAHARGSYKPPGPPEDPWGPYIKEASKRFDMPEGWVRAVMRQESGGNLYRANGDLITSGAGAMGLMQVMPGTYDELRSRYDLGDDPFDPHENIMAGVAYMREMYDIYGSPGFLAAYNAGPARLDDYLTNNRGLPNETRRYVAAIAPNLYGSPRVPSPAEQFEMNALPVNIPAGLRYGRGAVQLASSGGAFHATAANTGGSGRAPARAQVQVAAVTPPAPTRHVPNLPPPRSQQFASVIATPSPPPAPQHAPSGIRLITPAMASESTGSRRSSSGSGAWAIQVGAYSNQQQAHTALGQARGHARAELGNGKNFVGTVHQGRAILYRARLTGLSKDSAVQACGKISRSRMNCIVLSPDAQS
ncbi:MAG: transglycosylase SLT domain-containing protein [Acetobacteraceae bacterium]